MFHTKPLSNTFGLEVLDANLHVNMDSDTIKYIEHLILEHKVVVFKGQELSPIEQIGFCRQFGEIEPHPLKNNTCPYREITYVSNVTENGISKGYPGPQFYIWHSDMCYEKISPKFSFLYAEQVPEIGGNTLFANTTKAYEDLDSIVKEKLQGKKATFGFSDKLMQRCKQRGYNLIIDKEDQKPDCAHPIFREHPLTKKISIFVNWTHTDSIIGVNENESEYYLNLLFEHSTLEKYIYLHKYHKNDLIAWDNSATLHTGDGTIEIDKPRVMRRVVIRF
ncbi:MAG: TauD/TfdA family dioxygenase [Wolbachia pipientis]|jgi:taurine dioxygenase|nr:TauD/TfdA family dioxygenase [Wolbachia pipientis]